MYVQSGVYDELMEKLKKKAESSAIGNVSSGSPAPHHLIIPNDELISPFPFTDSPGTRPPHSVPLSLLVNETRSWLTSKGQKRKEARLSLVGNDGLDRKAGSTSSLPSLER